MPWLRLTIETDAEHAEPAAEFLELFGASAVSFAAADDEKIFDQTLPPTHTLWQQTQVSALLPHDVDLDILLVCLGERIGVQHIHSRSISQLDEQDWVADYQKSVALQWYGERLCICPSWLTPPRSAVQPIILDPGLAFGTGTHATTQLCLNWLTSLPLDGKTVIDYGCGSGILALAAARLGAEQVYAVDIDPQAVSACEQNVANNQLHGSIHTGLCDMPLPVADVLVANVLLTPLQQLAERLASLLRPGGALGLSGLLATQTAECLASYEQWFTMTAPETQQEWAMLNGRRRTS